MCSALLCLAAQSCWTLCSPVDCSPTRLLCPWGFSSKEYWSGVPCPPQPRDQSQVSHIAGRFSTDWATREVYAILFLLEVLEIATIWLLTSHTQTHLCRANPSNDLFTSCLGQRSLAAYSSQGHKQSDTTEATWHAWCIWHSRGAS